MHRSVLQPPCSHDSYRYTKRSRVRSHVRSLSSAPPRTQLIRHNGQTHGNGLSTLRVPPTHPAILRAAPPRRGLGVSGRLRATNGSTQPNTCSYSAKKHRIQRCRTDPLSARVSSLVVCFTPLIVAQWSRGPPANPAPPDFWAEDGPHHEKGLA